MIDERRLYETLRAFVAAPSPQTDLGQVRRFIRDVVRPRLPADYFDRVELDEDGNLIVRLHGEGPEKPFLLCAYGATFPPERMLDAFIPAEVEGGAGGPSLRGRGVAEQMSALAAAVEALRSLADTAFQPRRGLIFTTTVAGEMGSHEVVEGMRRRGSLDAGDGMLAVASSNALCLGNMGRVDVHVEVRGRSCHSSTPERGLNALDGACRALQRLRAVPLAEDPELGRPTLTPTHLQTWPQARHTVPDLAEITLDRRLVPGEEIGAAVREIAAALEPMAPFEVQVRTGAFNYPNKVAPDVPVAEVTRRALREVIGAAPVTYWRATLDAGYFTRHGVPTVIFGPGDMTLAHTDEEWVPLRQVVEAAEIYRRVCIGMCA